VNEWEKVIVAQNGAKSGAEATARGVPRKRRPPVKIRRSLNGLACDFTGQAPCFTKALAVKQRNEPLSPSMGELFDEVGD